MEARALAERLRRIEEIVEQLGSADDGITIAKRSDLCREGRDLINSCTEEADPLRGEIEEVRIEDLDVADQVLARASRMDEDPHLPSVAGLAAHLAAVDSILSVETGWPTFDEFCRHVRPTRSVTAARALKGPARDRWSSYADTLDRGDTTGLDIAADAVASLRGDDDVAAWFSTRAGSGRNIYNELATVALELCRPTPD